MSSVLVATLPTLFVFKVFGVVTSFPGFPFPFPLPGLGAWRFPPFCWGFVAFFLSVVGGFLGDFELLGAFVGFLVVGVGFFGAGFFDVFDFLTVAGLFRLG